MANLYNEEIQKIYIDIESGDLPDFSAKAEEAAKKLGELRMEADKAEKAMATLAAQGKASSDEFITLQIHSEDLKAEIKALNKEQKEYANALDITQMSSKQLADKAKVLRQALNDMSQAADPETWDRLNDEYIKVTRRMSEVRAGTIRVSDSMDITQMSTRQLAAYSKQLAERMADIPGAASNQDWQRLKGRLDDVKKQLREVGESSLKEGAKATMWGNLWTKAVTTGTQLLKKFGLDFISNSNAIGDRWNRTMAGMRTAYEALLTTFATGDWSHLFSNMSKAFVEGKKLEEIMEVLFEYQNAGKLSEVRNEIEIAELEGIMRDSSASTQERFEASGKVIELQTENLRNSLRIAEKAREGALASIQIKSGLKSDEVKAMVDDYFDNEELISRAQEYIEALSMYARDINYMESVRNDTDSPLSRKITMESDDFKETEKRADETLKKIRSIEQAVPEIQAYAAMLEKYDLLNDENISQYVDAQVNYLQAFANFNRDIARAQRTRNKMMQEMASERLSNAVAAANLEAQEEENIYKQKFADREISEEDLTAELKRIAEDRLEKIIAVTQQEYNNAVAMTNKVAEEEKIAAQKKYNNRIISETELSQELERIENDRQQGLKGVDELFKPELVSATSDFLNNVADIMKGLNVAATGSEDTLDAALQKAKEVNAELEKMLEKSMEAATMAVQDDLQSQDSQLASDIEMAGRIKTRYADKGTKLELLSVDKDAEMAHMRSLYEQGLITEEEYQKARVDIIRKYSAQAMNIQSDGWEDNLQMASDILNRMANMVNSIQQAQAASLEAQMQKELAAAGNNADQRAAIEEKYEAKKLELQKKYADINMGIQIAQAVASGALAMVQAWNAAGANPILAGIIMGLIGATTAAQIATIIAQRNAVMNSTSASGSYGSSTVRTVTSDGTGSGYSEGGFTGYGGRLEPAGIVHRGEYVVPVPEMRDPEAYSHVVAIERIRSRRTGKNRLPGFADGGYTGNPAMPGTALDGVMSELRALRRNPIKAYVVLSEMDAQRELRDTHLKAGSRQ